MFEVSSVVTPEGASLRAGGTTPTTPAREGVCILWRGGFLLAFEACLLFNEGYDGTIG